MRTRTKTILSFVLTVLVIGSFLAGCGPKPTAAPATAAPATQAPATAAPATAAPATAAPAAPAPAAGSVAVVDYPIFLAAEDEPLCNDCGTCYQELPQFFEKTKLVINGESRVVARMIPGAIETVEITPEIAKRIERVRANCDAEIIR